MAQFNTLYSTANTNNTKEKIMIRLVTETKYSLVVSADLQVELK